MVSAAILGDTVNYWIGHFIGPRIYDAGRGYSKDTRWIKKEHLTKAHRFYEKYGGQAIILARFIPIIRTFAPFVAGVAKMTYPHFLVFNIVGGIIWISLFLFGGFFFGNLPFVKSNFEYIVIAIIVISLIPMAIEVYKALNSKNKSA